MGAWGPFFSVGRALGPPSVKPLKQLCREEGVADHRHEVHVSEVAVLIMTVAPLARVFFLPFKPCSLCRLCISPSLRGFCLQLCVRCFIQLLIALMVDIPPPHPPNFHMLSHH